MSAPTLVGVIGLARSGRSAARLARASGIAVFASDAGEDPAIQEAAAEVRKLGGEAETGGHTVARLAECDLLVVSPGVPPDAAVLTDERLAGVPVTSELEFAARRLDAPIIAVTGTNGKTTVTAWIAHLLRTAGLDAVAAGNIGTPLSEVPLRETRPDWVVVEASSYQLGRIDTFAPRIGVVTNLAPDHLDRYPDVAAYYADKARLFDNAGPESVWVLNGDDEAVLRLPGDAPGRRLLFRTESRPALTEDGAWLGPEGRLMLRHDGAEEALVHEGEIGLLGRHNRANALAAALAARSAGVSAELAAGLRSFRPIPHRLEPVADVAGVLYVNDSKATNVASARVAVESMDRPVVLLLGGRHKGEDYGDLGGALDRVRAVVAFGESAERVERDLRGRVRVETCGGPLEEVVDRAAELARTGDVVLLAPACASYDMFENYEARGRRFADVVRARSEETVGVDRG